MADPVSKVARATGGISRQAKADPRIVVMYATVTSVVSTNPTVVTTDQTGDVQVTGLGSYNPVVDDAVAIVKVDGSPLLLGTTGSSGLTRKRGTASASIADNARRSSPITVNFPADDFTTIPHVDLTVVSSIDHDVRLTALPTVSGFTFVVFRTDESLSAGGESCTVDWWADV